MNKKIISLALFIIIISNLNVAFAMDSQQVPDFFDLINLELPQLAEVKTAVQANNYTAATTALFNHLKTRTYPVWYNKPSPPKSSTTYNTAKADAVLAHNFTCNSITACPDDPVGNINWTYTPNGDPEWYWALNRHFGLKDLAYAYYETGQDKYAAGFAEIFSDWYADNPVPTQVDTTRTWRTIEAGLRLSESMIYYFNTFLYAEAVPDSVKLDILKSLYDHGEYLYSFHGTNNWLLFECRGLYGLSMFFPEFKESEKWKETAISRLQGEYQSQFLEDGWQYELTPNYHIEAAKSIYAVQEIAQMNGTNISFADDLLKSYEISGNLILPGGKTASLNDTSYVLGNEFLYQGTKLAESSTPDKTGAFMSAATNYMNGDNSGLNLTKLDDWAGIIHFRDYRGKDEIYGMFEAGEAGVGTHGWSSRDKLQFILSANDRELLTDPGCHSYTSEPVAKYMYTTPAHNTVTIDGYEQVRRGQNLSRPAQNVDFYTSDGFDFASGLYNETFDETFKIPVTHKRDVAYVKSGYFVINDTFTGNGSHTARQFWNFAPAPYTVDSATGRVNTNFADGSNVLIIPVDYTPNTIEAKCGATSPYRGWAVTAPNVAVPSLNINYQKSFTNSGKMQTVIIPYKGDEPPSVTVTNENGVVTVEFAEHTDKVFFGNGTFGSYEFSGTAAVVRENEYGFIGINKYPQSSGLLYSGNNIAAPSIPNREKPVFDTLLPAFGMVQAEWAGIERSGDFQYVTENNGAVKLQTRGKLTFQTTSGLTGVVIRARANTASVVKVTQNGIDKGTINISAGTAFNNYTQSGLSGGTITVERISGEPIIDYITLNGSSVDKVGHYILRNRIGSEYSGTKFGSSSHTDYSITADMKLVTPLTNNASCMGILIRDNYKLEYNGTAKTITIFKDNTPLDSKSANLAFDEWYTFYLSVTGSSITASVGLKGVTSQKIAQLSATDVTYTSGMAGIYCQYADSAADNVVLTLLPGNSVYMSEDFERYAVATRASNWIDTEGSLWRTEPVIKFKEPDVLIKDTLLDESFSTYTGGLLSRWSGTAANLTAVNAGGDMKMQLSNPSGTSEVYYSMAQSASNFVMIEADYTFLSLSNAPVMIFRNGSGAESFNFKFDTDGKIKSAAAGSKVFGSYVPNKKYRVRMMLDTAAKKYDLYLNNVQIASNEPLLGTADSVKTVYFLKLWNAENNAIIDNARIANILLSKQFEVQNLGETVVLDSTNYDRGTSYLGIYKNNQLLRFKILDDGKNIIPMSLQMPFYVKIFNWLDLMPASDIQDYTIN